MKVELVREYDPKTRLVWYLIKKDGICSSAHLKKKIAKKMYKEIVLSLLIKKNKKRIDIVKSIKI